MISVTNLVKHHGSLRVLDGASLEVPRGEVAVVVGPSGGGKSTLLRCINGLEPFQGGEVRVQDLALRPDDVQRASGQTLLALRRRVGMVFQQFNLFPHLTVLQNVLIGPRLVLKQPRAEAEPLARQLLDRVGLGDKLHAKPEQLSGGQQQRVAIARALAVKPEAILFDEPTSALDPRMAGEVLAVIADLARQGQTMVVVTHAMSFARNVATTVHVMHAGRVAESGPPARVFDDPQSDVTRHFLAEVRAS
ncbi:MAG TPA: amino acid ABC transporter ATP-binding protein [Gemmataceae bacterium]|jgi:ABC-type polar amino acid transport system ATPase subunit